MLLARRKRRSAQILHPGRYTGRKRTEWTATDRGSSNDESTVSHILTESTFHCWNSGRAWRTRTCTESLEWTTIIRNAPGWWLRSGVCCVASSSAGSADLNTIVIILQWDFAAILRRMKWNSSTNLGHNNTERTLKHLIAMSHPVNDAQCSGREESAPHSFEAAAAAAAVVVR